MKAAFIIIATLAVIAVARAYPRDEFEEDNNAIFETNMGESLSSGSALNALNDEETAAAPAPAEGGEKKGGKKDKKDKKGKGKGGEKGKGKGGEKKGKGGKGKKKDE